MKLRIGTRKSRLALAQTELVSRAIRTRFPDVQTEIVPMGSPGDRAPERALAEFGGKGAFTQDLERALLSGEIDLAVHSAKDLPVELPRGLSCQAVLTREDPADVLVTVSGIPAAELPVGSVIGSGSLRRGLQFLQIRPQARMKPIRGNVPTRLQKLRDGQYDGILLAAAGLSRLGLLQPEGLHVEMLDREIFLPAPGQGILCAEFRTGGLAELLEALQDAECAAAFAAEREFLRGIGGGCSVPCAAFCRREADRLRMDVMYAADGKHPVRRSGSVPLPVTSDICETVVRQSTDDNAGSTVPDTFGTVAAREWNRSAEELAAGLAAQVRLQPVALVGAGPGNVGLITERGLACIRQADVLVYDNLIPVSLVNEAPSAAELVYVGKRAGEHTMTQEQINGLLVREASAGKRVVRLKGGDPFVFGRGGEEALALREQGIPYEVVPGVTSACAVPAFAGIPVTDRSCASSFHVITGHEGGSEAAAPDYEVLAKEKGTLIFLMAVSRLPEIVAELIRCGKDPEMPAAVIERGTTAGQKKVCAVLREIAAAVQEQGVRPPAVFVVGEAAALGDRLEWFGGGPLAGVRVLSTGTRRFCAALDAELAPLGAQTDAVSLIECVRLWKADRFDRLNRNCEMAAAAIYRSLREMAAYTWLVFTSANGVELFFELLTENQKDLRSLAHLKFAVIGRGTAAALNAHGFRCDYVPESGFSGEDLARGWLPLLTASDRVLLLRASEGSPALPERLSAAGIPFTDVPLYENRTDRRRGADLRRLVNETDYVVLASSSAARAFAELLNGVVQETMDDSGAVSISHAYSEKNRLAGTAVPAFRAKVVAIGPYTARAAKEAGIPVYVQAAEYTAAGIAAAILADRIHSGRTSAVTGRL